MSQRVIDDLEMVHIDTSKPTWLPMRRASARASPLEVEIHIAVRTSVQSQKYPCSFTPC